jgi:hypothetical protein
MSNAVATKPKVRRPGSGRTKGSNSFVKITVADLVAKFADQTTPVIVGRKWAEMVGFTGLVSKPAGATVDTIEGLTPETQIKTTIRNFNEED